MRPILLDTHAALWSAEGTLRKSVMERIDDAAMRSQLILSPISAWEIGMLVQRRRITLSVPVEEYIQKLYGANGVVTAALTPSIALAAATLPKTMRGDPADRLLVATAIAYRADLFTRDSEILRFAKSSGALTAFRI